MKYIVRKTVTSVRWREFRDAGMALLMLFGAVDLYLLFTDEQRSLIRWFLVIAGLSIYAVSFCGLCVLRDAIEKRHSARTIRRIEKQRMTVEAHPMRRRFVYFDAEKGEDIYKMEPAN